LKIENSRFKVQSSRFKVTKMKIEVEENYNLAIFESLNF
jgi:hypothetical protein